MEDSVGNGQGKIDHDPVMVGRIVDLLAPALTGPNARYLDLTVGLGGHAAAILDACPSAVAVGIDRDAAALAIARRRLERFGDRVRLMHAVSDDLDTICADIGWRRISAVVLDLGVSSMHLDVASRGFAYRFDSPLDMRMDQESGRTAADLLNTCSPAELTQIFREYGEERYAGRIAQAVVKERANAPWRESAPLVDLIRRVVPPHLSGHPAKRVFQALRIAINDELAVLSRTLPAALSRLVVGGRCAVLAYHSLEDRIVKHAFAAGLQHQTPADLPVLLPEHAPFLQAVTRGAERPSDNEVTSNPRASSARLRVVERIRDEGEQYE
ncbi:MAG: 16S rRNA (cytosine(1402)-N(4))-methyltransferase RsmH [Actinomycetota bacterium]